MRFFGIQVGGRKEAAATGAKSIGDELRVSDMAALRSSSIASAFDGVHSVHFPSTHCTWESSMPASMCPPRPRSSQKAR